MSGDKGIIVIMGDDTCNIENSAGILKPKYFAFLCFSNEGLANAVQFIKKSEIDLDFCHFEVLKEKKMFFSKCATLAHFIVNESNAEISAVCTGTLNCEALALAAITAYQNQTDLRIDDKDNHILVSSTEAILISLLSDIVREFNLHHYRNVINNLEKIDPSVKSSKGKAYIALIGSLASAYLEWDGRRYTEAASLLASTKSLIEHTPNDFSRIRDETLQKIDLNMTFLKLLSENKENLGSIDAYFNGNRRYDASDNLISILTLANSVEFCLRSRMILKGLDPDDSRKINQGLNEKLKEKATEFFLKNKIYHVDSFEIPGEKGSKNAAVTLGFTYKPGFQDLLKILSLLEDDFYKEIEGLIQTANNPSYLSITELNVLRNAIVHKMGTVDDEDLPKAIKLTQFILERFLQRLVVDAKESFPQLISTGTEPLISQALKFGNHYGLDIGDITIGIFS